MDAGTYDDSPSDRNLVPVTAGAPLAPSQPAQADSDEQLISLWMHGRPATTARAYRQDWGRFSAFVAGKPLHSVKLIDVQDYADSLCCAAAPIAN